MKMNNSIAYYELQMNIMSEEIQALRDKVSINLLSFYLFIFIHNTKFP
jgi:hypothetical protein